MRECAKCGLKERDLGRTQCLVCGGPLVDEKDRRIGSILSGRYRLEDMIGEGGMATVYRARHTLMERPYAVKILRRELAQDEKLVERMRREGRSAAALTHPNIVEIYDFGMTDDGAPFLVMELLDGEPLRKLLWGGPVAFELLVKLATQIARGLARAHDFGVVHRDLKPENIFVCKDDEGEPLVKIVDFGIARSREDSRLTNRGEVMGTPQYMAPERATSRDVTASCDLYSFGIMLFEMATGVLPFQSNSPTGMVLKHIHEAPPRPSAIAPGVDPRLESLIMDLIEKDPHQRPVDVHQVLARLHALAPEAELSRPSRPERQSLTVVGKSESLDRWKLRADILERMLERAYPDAKPPEQAELFAELRAGLARLRTLEDDGLAAQVELDELEREAREASERLGHAVHVLAKDLSRAREEARSARQESKDRLEAALQAKDGYHHMLVKLEVMTQSRPGHPGVALVEVSRALADATEAWQRADEAATRSTTRAERSEAEVKDIDFQVGALRTQLEHLERSIGERGATSRAVLEGNAEERHEVERRLARMVTRLVAPLKDFSELRELFIALEGISPSTEPLPVQADSSPGASRAEPNQGAAGG
jgi:serine/threonine-protein kinase